MKIAIIGATGSIGSRITLEALRRRHQVLAIARDPSKLSGQAGLTTASADTSNPQDVASKIEWTDVLVTAVRWSNNHVEDVIAAAQRAKVHRSVFVIGAGSLVMPDGRLWFDHMKDQGTLPPTSGPALAAFQRLQAEKNLDWVAASPAAEIEPGDRTGQFQRGGDLLLSDAEGRSRISFEDFAVAILDEIEKPTISRARFTVAY